MYQPKVSITQKYSDSQGTHIVHEAKLIFMDVNFIEEQNYIYLNTSLGERCVKPIIISETEEIEVDNHFIWIDSLEQGIKKAIPMDVYVESNEIPIDLIGKTGRKVLALSEHFSNKHLQAISDGKMKDGDSVLIRVKTDLEKY